MCRQSESVSISRRQHVLLGLSFFFSLLHEILNICCPGTIFSMLGSKAFGMRIQILSHEFEYGTKATEHFKNIHLCMVYMKQYSRLNILYL